MSNSNSGGIRLDVGFCGLLTLIFITLKLCNVITWSWLWVLAPIWIPIAICMTIALGILLVAILAAIVHAIDRKRQRSARERLLQLTNSLKKH